ncbi:MAG: twin-arginine translocase subunit TatC, partial [Halobacteriaceae archaeon]
MSAGPIDEDTARTIQSGRESMGAVLATVQERLQRAFVAFALGLLVGILVMRRWVWPTLKADLLPASAEVVVLTPFDVILLQVKIGLVVGILCAIPTVLYYSRHSLAERGVIRDVPVSRWKAVVVALVGLALFVGGALYAYLLFFPIMFDFLASNATNAGFSPRYSIVAWTQFILVLGLSFGLAAQLPLAMTALSYSGVVPYETFRDKWKIAVVLIFTFGAVFSPPDPFTQIMWAAPLVALYGLSLYLSKLVVTAKRGGADADLRRVLRRSWNHIAGAAVLSGGVAYAAFRFGLVEALNEGVLPALPTAVRPAPLPTLSSALGLPPETAFAVVAVAAGGVGAVLATLSVAYRGLEAAAPAEAGAAGGTAGTPAGVDLADLDAAGVRAAP